MKPPLRTVLRNFLNHFEDYEARKTLSDDQYEYEFQVIFAFLVYIYICCLLLKLFAAKSTNIIIVDRLNDC